MLLKDLPILGYTGEGYSTVLNSGDWRIGFIRHSARFDRANFVNVERHLLTDEAFLLLSGEATLIFGDRDEKIPMKKETVYNVPAGEWHHCWLSEDALVMVVEKKGTDDSNTEFRDKL